MKKFFFIVYGIIMLITVVASIYLYLNQKPVTLSESDEVNPTPVAEDLGPLYAYSPNGERGPLLEPNQGALSVNPETGSTILAEESNYTLEYFPDSQSFTITLIGSNLRESRVMAEANLLNRFQITQEQACSLSVLVVTTVNVSEKFADQQLGLSFCPGRVDLPTEPGGGADVVL